MQMGAHRTEKAPKPADIALGQVANCDDAVLMHPLERDAPHAPEPLDWQWPEKFRQMLRAQQQQAVRLRHVAQDFRRHLGRRDPHRNDEAGFIADAPAKRDRDLMRRAEQSVSAGQIDKRLIKRERFNDRAETLEDAANLARDFEITAHAAGNENSVRTKLARLRPR